ncbi:MAG TPA: hypothetical protein VMV83_05500 [Rectinemataceae bacterium]|nr:hypothetical protein [Rectinemataceae bacterium]
MHIIDMTLYLDIELAGLDEVGDAGRFIVMFESGEEYEASRAWIERHFAHPSSKIRDTVPADRVNWHAGPFIIMLYNGGVEYAEYVAVQNESAFVRIVSGGQGAPDRAFAHHHA